MVVPRPRPFVRSVKVDRPHVPEGINIIANSTMPGNITGWVGFEAAPTYDATETHTADGSGALRIIGRDAGDPELGGDFVYFPGGWGIMPALTPFVAGNELTLSAWFKSAVDDPTFSLVVNFYDGPNINVDDFISSSLLVDKSVLHVGTDWTLISIPNSEVGFEDLITIPVGATHCFVWGNGGDIGGAYIWVDDVFLGTP